MTVYAFVGSRGFARPSLVRQYVHQLKPGDVIVSGACPNSPDEWAAHEAQYFDIEVREFPADWARYGKRAGFIRNQDIINAADRVLAFWDGTSKGTAHDIALAQQAGKPLLIIYPDGRTEKR